MIKAIVLFLMVVALGALIALAAAACPAGTTEYNGSCAADLVPETAPAVQPSDEKPPRSGRASYDAPGIHADTPKSEKDKDQALDDQKQVPGQH